VYGSRIVSGLAVVFGGMTVLFVVLALVYNLVFLAVAAVFGLSAYFVWYHASGRLARRLYRGVEAQAEPSRDGFGAGPRADWEPPRDGRTVGGPGRRARADPAGATAGRAGREGPRRQGTDGPTADEAYDALGLSPDADESAVRAAYRQKVKEVHPDQPGGDEDRFKKVQAAYERLTD
jgi:hypothetical protein